MNTEVGSVAGMWKQVVGCSLAAFLLLSFSPARGDVVAEWNAIAVRMAASSPPSRAARELAAVHVAMFETMNFIEGKYIPVFLVKPPSPLGSSGEAQGIGAAHYVLTQIYPEQKAALDAALERSLAAFPDSEEASRARVWGSHLGGSVYTVFASDGFEIRTDGGLSDTRGETWHAIAARSLEGRTLQPIERARIYALVTLAASAAAENANAGQGSAAPCVPCAVGAAVRVVLQAEIGSAYEPHASKAGEAAGTKAGLRALTYYRRIR
jgi:hypothetical protein